MNCYKCSKELSLKSDQIISRQEVCPHCYASIHACFQCFFYDKNSYNECKEPMADRITDKEKANFCDFYKIKTQSNNPEDEKAAALKAAMDLFKK